MRRAAKPAYRRKHVRLMAFWFLNIPVVFIFDLDALARYIAAVSIYANFATHWSADQAECAERAVRG